MTEIEFEKLNTLLNTLKADANIQPEIVLEAMNKDNVASVYLVLDVFPAVYVLYKDKSSFVANESGQCEYLKARSVEGKNIYAMFNNYRKGA